MASASSSSQPRVISSSSSSLYVRVNLGVLKVSETRCSSAAKVTWSAFAVQRRIWSLPAILTMIVGDWAITSLEDISLRSLWTGSGPRVFCAQTQTTHGCGVRARRRRGDAWTQHGIRRQMRRRCQ
eukprot:scaffold388_cov111-Isochrysis_galbana.AAC.1